MAKRKRKAEIREDLQPAIDFEVLASNSSRFGFPPSVFSPRGGILHFHGVAIITGDGLYRGYNSKGELKHCIVTNPEAASRQSEYLARIERR
jgi:hypothetical protein